MSFTPTSGDRESLAAVSLISGFASVLAVVICSCFTLVLSFVAIGTGTYHLVRRGKVSQVDDVWAKGGIALGILGLLIFALILLL